MKTIKIETTRDILHFPKEPVRVEDPNAKFNPAFVSSPELEVNLWDTTKDITGSKKGGGGGGSKPELPNTLASRAILKILILTSEGPIQGLPGGPQAIYINDTPLQNADGSWNFQHCAYDYRVGYPDQAKVDGYMEAASLVDVNATLVKATPVIREVSSEDIDAVKVIVTLPTGLVYQWQGQLWPTWAHITIDRKLSTGGTWEQVVSQVINGKTDSATQKEFRVPRPAGTGKWQYRVTRITDDSTTSGLRNDTSVAAHVEYSNIDNNYPNCAYVALAIDAEAVGGQIPNVAILTKGLTVRVPTNYNPDLGTYSGMYWDGTWKNAWTDNPAWITYDLLTNTRYGMGARGITDDMVDRFSFYDAGVYNDGYVPDGYGGTERRFTFNYPVAAREDAWTHLTAIAGSMHATLIQSRGQIRLSQDRPSSPYMLITKANVFCGEDGSEAPFTYKGTALDERPTSFNVTYADRTDRNLPRIVTVYDEDLIDQYGLTISEISAFGATTAGQALRHGKWALDTSHHQTEIAQWRMGMNGADLEPGHIVEIWDEDYTDEAGAGRIISSTVDTVTLDRPCAITDNATIQIIYADGKTITTKTITNPAGTYTTLTIDTMFTQTVLPGADYIISATVSPRQFRITSVLAEEDLLSIEAIFHDPNKFARIELGIEVPSPIFSDSEPSICNAPSGLTVRESIVSDNNQINRQLLVSWLPPSQGKVSSYTVSWRRENEDWNGAVSRATGYTINGATPGNYEIAVSAKSVFGIPGPSATIFYNIDTTGSISSTLNPVVELKVADNGSTTEFPGRDLNISFRNPASNANVPGTLVRDFQVTIVDPDTDLAIRAFYVAGVPAGVLQSFTYTYSDNLADGGPKRNLTVSVRCRDTSNNLSSAAEITVENPPPAFVADFDATSGIGQIYITHTRPTDSDYVGVLIWRGTSAGFTPSSANLLFQGDATFFTDTSNLSAGTTFYYKIAAYDDFGFESDFSDLNISAAQSAQAIAYPGVPGGTSFPTTPAPAAGDSFYRTDLGILFFYSGTAWEQVGIESGTTLPTTGNFEDRQFILTPGQNLYIYHTVGGWTPITPANGTITTGMIVAGAITTGKIATGAVTANEIAASTITSGKIAANTIVTANLATGIITTAELAAGAVTAAKIAANTITANEIQAGAITTATLAAGAVTAGKINVTKLNAITANMGNLTAGQIDIASDENGAGWGYIRNSGKWYRDNQNGWVFGRHPNGDSLMSIECGASKMWAYSSGDFGIQAPGILMTNGGLTINQLDVIGTANIRDANIGTLKLASGASTTASGNYRDGRQFALGWNTYAECGIYVPYGGTLIIFMSAQVQGPWIVQNGGGEGDYTWTTISPTYSRILINGGVHVQYEDIAGSAKIGQRTQWCSNYAVGVGGGYFTCSLQFYFDQTWNTPGTYKTSIVAFASTR
ncbi:phage tail protein [Variovorax sp. J22R193]|uniref:host specificity protein J n=1 Tax=Variovorax fucosicus TaxID=3053517 RepID=UPI0025767597|nr:phage tail protein [Variovorax sp. J22R193]MDM0042153.1 phage tail protein [Variovorax sp. J22R193]